MSGPRIDLVAAGHSWCAWTPDLPGCIATGATEEEARERMEAAVAMHLEGLKKADMPTPPEME